MPSSANLNYNKKIEAKIHQAKIPFFNLLPSKRRNPKQYSLNETSSKRMDAENDCESLVGSRRKAGTMAR